MTTPLPRPVASYLSASNAGDLDALMATLSDDALVNDAHRDFWGADAIRRWAQREIIDDKVTMEVTQVIDHHGEIILTARMDGTYDKTHLPDPLVLTFYFALKNDRIVRLFILHNTPAVVRP